MGTCRASFQICSGLERGKEIWLPAFCAHADTLWQLATYGQQNTGCCWIKSGLSRFANVAIRLFFWSIDYLGGGKNRYDLPNVSNVPHAHTQFPWEASLRGHPAEVAVCRVIEYMDWIYASLHLLIVTRKKLGFHSGYGFGSFMLVVQKLFFSGGCISVSLVNA